MRLLLFDIDGTLVPHRRRRLARHDARLRGDARPRGRAEEGRPGRPHRPHHHARRADARRPRHTRTSISTRFRQAYCAALREEITEGRATAGAACCPACEPLLTRSRRGTTSAWRCSPATSAPPAEIKLAAFDVWDYFSWGAFADDAIERDDLIRIAHARHETSTGTLIEPERSS